MKSIIVIPTYNERDNIRELIATIRKQVFAEKPEILVVDSASPDGTAAAVEEICKTDAGVHLFSQPKKLGLGKAYMDGMRWVLERNYDCLVTMDADFSHHPRYLPTMLNEITLKDLVIGSRYVDGGALKSWPYHRRLLSKFANWYARTLTGLPFSDLTAGFHCFRTPLLKRVLSHPLETEGYAFLVELKFLSILEGAKYREIPIVFSDRTKGASKISKQVIWESVMFTLKLARHRAEVLERLKEKPL